MTNTKLKNGMRVNLVPVAGTQAVTVLVHTDVGSRYEPDHLWGASHFIEHLMFKGTEKRPNTIDISRELEQYGAQFNAYTGKDMTGYYVKIDAKHAELAIDMLHDMIFNSKYDPAEMDKERQVIIEEIKMYEENPIMHIGYLLEESLFAGNALAKEIAGSPESMMAMKREDIIDFRDRNYNPETMVVTIAGAIPNNISELLEATFGTVAKQEERSSIDDFILPNPTVRAAVQSKPLEQVQLAIGFYGPGRDSEDKYAAKLLGKILGGGMSSRLFIEVRERLGLCYSIRASADSYAEIGDMSISAGLDASRMDVAAKAIFEEIEKVRNGDIRQEELDYVKTNLEGALKLKLENSTQMAEFVGQQELQYGKVESLDEVLHHYQSVTLEDIHEQAKAIFDTKNVSIAAIGPYENKDELLKHFSMLQ